MLVKVLIRELLVVSELVGLLHLRACCVFVLPRATSAPILHCVLTPTNLSGSIPKSLTAITILQVLDMSNNNFFWRSSVVWFVFVIHPYQFCEQPLCGHGTTNSCPGAPPFYPPPPYKPTNPCAITR